MPQEVEDCVNAMKREWRKGNPDIEISKKKLTSMYAICKAQSKKEISMREITAEGLLDITGCTMCESSKEANKGFRIIKFIAITNRESNNERAPRQILKASVASLKNKPMVDYHPEKTFWSWKRKFGIVIEAEYKEDEITIGGEYYPELPRIECKAEIFDSDIVTLLDRALEYGAIELLPKFSVSYLFNAIPDDEGVLIWTWVEFRNVGMVDLPADDNAQMLSVKENNKQELPSMSCDFSLEGQTQNTKEQHRVKETDTMDKEDRGLLADTITAIKGLKERIGTEDPKTEVKNMESVKEFTEALQEKEATIASMKEEQVKLSEEQASLKEQVEKLAGIKEELDTKTKELDVAKTGLKEIEETKHTESVTAAVKELIKDGKVAPADEESTETFLKGLKGDVLTQAVEMLSKRPTITVGLEAGEQEALKEGQDNKEKMSETLYGMKEAALVAQLSSTQVPKDN